MGRILLYVTTGCSHCIRAERLLESKKIPYIKVNLALEPHRRQEMLLASHGKKTVPQIFFNYTHVGVSTGPKLSFRCVFASSTLLNALLMLWWQGADDLFALEEGGILDTKLRECLAETHPELEKVVETNVSQSKEEDHCDESSLDDLVSQSYSLRG